MLLLLLFCVCFLLIFSVVQIKMPVKLCLLHLYWNTFLSHSSISLCELFQKPMKKADMINGNYLHKRVDIWQEKWTSHFVKTSAFTNHKVFVLTRSPVAALSPSWQTHREKALPNLCYINIITYRLSSVKYALHNKTNSCPKSAWHTYNPTYYITVRKRNTFHLVHTTLYGLFEQSWYFKWNSIKVWTAWWSICMQNRRLAHIVLQMWEKWVWFVLVGLCC